MPPDIYVVREVLEIPDKGWAGDWLLFYVPSGSLCAVPQRE